jgi:hypothetical protein
MPTTIQLSDEETEALKYALQDIADVYAEEDDDPEVQAIGETLIDLRARLGWTAE